MSATETQARAGWSRRATAFVAMAVIAVVGAALTMQARSGQDRTRLPDFWTAFSMQASETFVPESMSQISRAADAIVLAHVVDVTEGRDIVPDEDPTPRDPAVPAPRSAYVYLEVDELVAGTVPPGERERLRLELFAPAAPQTVDDLRADLPKGQALFYLWNGALSAARHGANDALQERERSNWLVASSLGVLTAGTYELKTPLHPGESGTPFLRSFGTNDPKVAAERSAEARRSSPK